MSMQNQLFLAPFILTILIKYVNQILTNCLYTNNTLNTLFTYAFMNIITKLVFPAKFSKINLFSVGQR